MKTDTKHEKCAKFLLGMLTEMNEKELEQPEFQKAFEQVKAFKEKHGTDALKEMFFRTKNFLDGNL